MSVATNKVIDRRSNTPTGRDIHRWVAIAALAVLSAVSLQLLHEAADVVEAGTPLALVSLVAIVLAVVAARFIAEPVAAKLTMVGVTVGLAGYLVTAPGGIWNLFAVWTWIRDTMAMISGVTILSIVSLDVWLLVVTPGPLFLSWYLVLRGRYVGGATVGLGVMTFLVTTGDVSSFSALLGVLATASVVGFGELHRRDARIGEADALILLLAVMLIASLTVSIVPGSGAQPLSPSGGGGGSSSIENALVGDEEVTVSGSPSLDPTVRFTVEADQEQNWRIDAYDRYTGDGWVQTGDPEPFSPQSPTSTGTESAITVEMETDVGNALPAPWRPVAVEGIDDPMQTPGDGLRSGDALDEGDQFEVVSERPAPDPGDLSQADSPPAEIVDRYTQLPESTPDRVTELTTQLVGDDEGYHEKARTIEDYLLETNDYSLDVSAPDGDIADAMLFERDEGYCTYFATTMAVMLRTQDVPARVVTGYSAGERVAEDRWVVRGMNAHAWVEVYVPDVGWVDYDPTPSTSYDTVRTERLQDARNNEEAAVDTNESGGTEWEPPTEDADEPPDVPDGAGDDVVTNLDELREACEDPQAVQLGRLTASQAQGICSPTQLEAMEGVESTGENDSPPEELRPDQTGGVTETSPDRSEPGTPLPDLDQLALALAVVVAGVASAHRRGVAGRVRYVVATRWQGRGSDPDGAAERAWHRLETQLAKEYTGRQETETVRTYVNRLSRSYDIDDRVKTVAATYEQARYGTESVSKETARETVAIVDELVGGRLPGSRTVGR